MLDNYKVAAVVPAGRRRYLTALVPYLLANRHIIDGCSLWCNAVDEDDIAYMHDLAARDDFFRVIAPSIPVDGVRSIYHFFKECVDPDTVYIRFDDDICWLAPGAVETLVRFRVDNPAYFLVFADTVNNNICSHLHQRLGCIGVEEGFCEYDAFGEVCYASPTLARLVHESFLQRLAADDLRPYMFSRWIAWNYDRISINCVSWLGREFAEFGGSVGEDEEAWLTQDGPRNVGKPTAICGTALAAHFAYEPQRSWLEANTENAFGILSHHSGWVRHSAYNKPALDPNILAELRRCRRRPGNERF